MIRCASCGEALRDEAGRFLGRAEFAECDYCGALICWSDECGETQRDGLVRCRLCRERHTLPLVDERGIDPKLIDDDSAP